MTGEPEAFPTSACEGWGGQKWAMVALVLLAWGLRLPPLLDAPLHPDEALYGYWGLLIGRGRDPWLTGVPVYKPPLWPYAISGFQILLGHPIVALRFPGLVAGVLAVPLVRALAQALYGDAVDSTGAAVAMALSPFALILSGSAFPDPLMVTLGIAACVAGARGRVHWAGLLAGLSFATKQTGLVWLPLVFAVALARRASVRLWFRQFAAWWLVPTLLSFAWDGVRVALGADSFWSAGVVGYGGLRLIWSHELWSRLRAWSRLMASLFESPPIVGLLLVGLPALCWKAAVRHPRRRRAFFDLLLVSFGGGYLLLHWLIAFPIWTRYLLPLVPVLAVLMGRIARGARCLWSDRVGQRPRLLISSLLLVVLLFLPAREASAGRSSLAGEQAAYEGIDEVIQFLGQLPEGSVVYHHWLGWHYHYGLFDGPVYLAYWPTPAWLAQDVQAFGGREQRFITFPAWESMARVEQALQRVGYALEPVLTVSTRNAGAAFIVYHIRAGSPR